MRRETPLPDKESQIHQAQPQRGPPNSLNAPIPKGKKKDFPPFAPRGARALLQTRTREKKEFFLRARTLRVFFSDPRRKRVGHTQLVSSLKSYPHSEKVSEKGLRDILRAYGEGKNLFTGKGLYLPGGGKKQKGILLPGSFSQEKELQRRKKRALSLSLLSRGLIPRGRSHRCTKGLREERSHRRYQSFT